MTTLHDIAPFPETQEQATPHALAAYYAVAAQKAGRIALKHPDAQVAGQAHRDVGLFYAIARLLRELDEYTALAGLSAARAVWEELEDGTHIAVDLSVWLAGYRISVEQVNAEADRMIAAAVQVEPGGDT